MSIDKIIQLMPVPDSPVEVADHNWAAVFTKLGVSNLPTDYKEFVSTYGTGSIGEFLWIMNPFSKNQNLNLEMAVYSRKAYEAMKQEFPDDFPRESNSLLTWAVTDNGDDTVWLLGDENPNLWQVGFHGRNVLEGVELTGLTTSEFLEAILEKKLESSIFPSDFLKADKKFTPV